MPRKTFYRYGTVGERLVLAEVKQIDWGSGYAKWVYETYPVCFKVVKKLGDVRIDNLPDGYKFIDFSKPIGSLPGVEEVYEATDEKVKEFLEVVERIRREEEEMEKKAVAELEGWKWEIETLKQEFEVVQTHELVHPKGGEDGVDGYYDVSLKAKATVDGEVVRMVARNVFDFGFYAYPKRVEGTQQVFESSAWTKLERRAVDWLEAFSPFTTNIRM